MITAHSFLGLLQKRARKDEQTNLEFNILRWQKDTILLKIFKALWTPKFGALKAFFKESPG